MTFPNIPDNINPIEDLDREQVALLLLASIAFEELGLAHIINAEAEKLQFALGTLNDDKDHKDHEHKHHDHKHHDHKHHDHKHPIVKDLDDLLDINRSVERVLRTVIKKEIILQFKLEDVIDFLLDD
jgi:ABC-type Zn2+ transport system substrate-binding protein/surface adhesin